MGGVDQLSFAGGNGPVCSGVRFVGGHSGIIGVPTAGRMTELCNAD